MKLITRTFCSDEDPEVGDFIVAPLYRAAVDRLAARIALVEQAHARDGDVREMSFQDFSPALATACGEIEEALGPKRYARLEDEDMLAVGDDVEFPDDSFERTDLRRMVVCRAVDGFEIEWRLNLKDTSTEFTSHAVRLAWIRRRMIGRRP